MVARKMCTIFKNVFAYVWYVYCSVRWSTMSANGLSNEQHQNFIKSHSVANKNSLTADAAMARFASIVVVVFSVFVLIKS